MTWDRKGKIELQFEGKKLVDLKLDEAAKIEISSFIAGYLEGVNCVMFGKVYGSVRWKVADKILNQYTDDTTTDRIRAYDLILEKLELKNF